LQISKHYKGLLAKISNDHKVGKMKTLTVSEAKDSLDKVLDEALAGEIIVITRQNQSVLLQPCQIPAPLPQHPPGYFDDCYTDKAECDLENRCGSASE